MTKRQTILVADDDSDLLKALTMRLWDLGFEVVTATDSYNALALATQSKPDLLLLDVNMPAGDGFSVQERLKTIDGLDSVPVIYMTGDKSERLDDIAQRIGGIAIFHKPFDLNSLLTTIGKILQPTAA